MLHSIVLVRPLGGYRLWLRFEDGIEGEVDVAKLVRLEDIFAPLQQLDFFTQVVVDPEIGTICWSNGADLDPDVLYAEVTGQPLPTFDDLLPFTAD